MGRRKQSIYEDLIDITSELPWWAGVVLAIVSYVLITIYAASYGTNNHLIGLFAAFFKVIIPLAFILSAIISAVKQWKRVSIFKRQTGIESIRNLTWYQFELLISEAFRRQGYSVRETEYGPDGGIDLILNKDNKKIFVQCKHWKTWKINVKPIRELQGIISVKGADGGIFVTSGKYTKDAISFAKECSIQLIDSDDLHSMFKGIDIDNTEPTVISERPNCPKCGNRMIKRSAKRGPNTGKDFWGCSTYPKCKGIINT